jgi:hypothetical protein
VTYHKFPKDDWPTDWFHPTEVPLPSGERPVLKLAEMGSWIGSRRDGLMVREVRKLGSSGHQTSMISSAYGQPAITDAAGLLSRWAQENFFRYMMQHYAIDLLGEYQTAPIPGPHRPVVNPPWRELDRQSRSLKSRLTNRQARFAAMTMHPQDDPKKMAQWERHQAALREEIGQLEHELDAVRGRLKETAKHIEWESLPQDEQFRQLAPSRKQLMDTVKMIAYRAETAMMGIVRESLGREDDARSLLRELFVTDADLHPDADRGELRVVVHSLSNPRSNRTIAHLLSSLNATELTYPGTPLKLVFALASDGNL